MLLGIFFKHRPTRAWLPIFSHSVIFKIANSNEFEVSDARVHPANVVDDVRHRHRKHRSGSEFSRHKDLNISSGAFVEPAKLVSTPRQSLNPKSSINLPMLNRHQHVPDPDRDKRASLRRCMMTFGFTYFLGFLAKS